MLDPCINVQCAGNGDCIAAVCTSGYASSAVTMYDAAIDCVYCAQCTNLCGC